MRRVILNKGEQFSNKHLKRTGAFNARAMEAATNIIEQVREQGDAALRELTERFDGVAIEDFRVPAEAIEAAAVKVDPKTEEALKKAAKQIREFHERQVKQSWFSVREDGALVGAKVTPLESVGIYVPGGRALYPSTVLMNALPAAVAGVERIVCVTPPTKDGSIDPVVLEACRLAGVTEIYTVGGAQAVAALAYGTETIEPVCKITGPGNAFVAAAKKIVSGDVGIDMIAGPSEVCVVADETADPAMVAIDLMAQAEHDPLASCYLVTFDEGYADKVEAAIEGHMKASTRAEITTASLGRSGPCGHLRLHGAGHPVRQRHRPRALGAAFRRRVRTARRHPQRRRHLRGRVDPRGRGRLRGRPQPHASHRRHRALRLAAFHR